MAEKTLLSKEDAEIALGKLNKANSKRREKLATEAGFANFFSYKGWLLECIAKEESNPTPIEEPKVVFETPKLDTKQLTDMVIAFDTTGSMRSYIDSVKKHVTELVPKLLSQNPNLMISIVAFGDYCDSITRSYDVNGNFGPAYQVIGLSNNTNELIDFINKAENTSGGDSDEFYELVLQKIRKETFWRLGANKSILLIADAKPHDKYWYQTHQMRFIDWREEAKLLKLEGIQVDTLQIRTHIEWYKELSQITDGLNLPFKDAEQTNNLIEMSALARGGDITRAAFDSLSLKPEIKNNVELTKSYSMYKGMVDKK